MKHAAIVLFSSLLLAACSEASSETAQRDPAPEVAATTPHGLKADSAAAGLLARAAGTYAIDPAHSAVAFSIRHMNVSDTLGLFNKVTGTLVLGASAADSSVDIQVDAASVFTALKKRDDHLKSPDFLNAAQFPTIRFKSTTVEPLGGDRYRVTGDLSLHGVTRRVTTELVHVGFGESTLEPGKVLTGFTGALAIKRTDFGMDNMVGTAGDEVALTIAVEGVRQ